MSVSLDKCNDYIKNVFSHFSLGKSDHYVEIKSERTITHNGIKLKLIIDNDYKDKPHIYISYGHLIKCDLDISEDEFMSKLDFVTSELFRGITFKFHEYTVVIGAPDDHHFFQSKNDHHSFQPKDDHASDEYSGISVFVMGKNLNAATAYSFPIMDYRAQTVANYIAFHKRLLEKLYKDAKSKNRCLVDYVEKLNSVVMKLSCTGYLVGEHKHERIGSILVATVSIEDICLSGDNDTLAGGLLFNVSHIVAIRRDDQIGSKYTFIYPRAKVHLEAWIEHIAESRSGKPKYVTQCHR